MVQCHVGNGLRQDAGAGRAAAGGGDAAARDARRVPRAEGRHRDRRQPHQLADRLQRRTGELIAVWNRHRDVAQQCVISCSARSRRLAAIAGVASLSLATVAARAPQQSTSHGDDSAACMSESCSFKRPWCSDAACLRSQLQAQYCAWECGSRSGHKFVDRVLGWQYGHSAITRADLPASRI